MADNGGPSRPRGIGAFSGGPLGVGWAPWAIGATALVAGVLIFSRRRAASGRPQAAGGVLPTTSQPSVNVFPYPTGPGAGGPNPSAKQLSQVTAGSSSQGLQGFGGQIPLYRAQDGTYQQVSAIPFGTQLSVTGASVQLPAPGGGAPIAFAPITYLGSPFLVALSDVTQPASNLSAQQLGNF